MLGWSVYVKEVDEAEGQRPVAHWMGEPNLLTEMEKLVEEGEAYLIESNGGYPYRFEVYSDILREWLEEDDPRLHRMFPKSDLYKLYINYERLDQILDGVLLSVSLMDQS